MRGRAACRPSCRTEHPLFNGPTWLGEDPRRCTFSEARDLDVFVGSWSGTTENGRAVHSETFPIVGGCALLQFLEAESDAGTTLKVARVTAFDRDAEQWVQYRIDNRIPVFERLEGARSGGVLEPTSVAPARAGLPLHRTRWRIGEDGRLLLEELESTDEGDTWTPVLTAHLESRRIR